MLVKTSTVRATKPVVLKRLIHSAVVAGSTTVLITVLVLTRMIARTCAPTQRRIHTIAGHVRTSLHHVQQTTALWNVRGLILQIVLMSAAAAPIHTVHPGTAAHPTVVVATQDQTMTLVVPVGSTTLALALLHVVLTAEVVAQVLVVPTQAQVALVLLLQEEVGVLLREVAKIDTILK
jgi:hypothetical protein